MAQKNKRAHYALLLTIFAVFLICLLLPNFFGGQELEKVAGSPWEEALATEIPTEAENANADGLENTEDEETTAAQMPEKPTEITDLTGAFEVILQGATKEFIAGYPVDQAFLLWLTSKYGEEAVNEIAYSILDEENDIDTWYQATGNSIHVLWVEYCKDSGFQPYQLEHVHWIETQSEHEVTFGFTGDFNFGENWCTTDYMNAQPNGIYDCFSENLLTKMQAVDILMVNNEFVYSDRGSALPGKAYTFRATPDKVKILEAFGADLANLANNHTYDYGEEALLDTMEYLTNAGVEYIGAGENLDEASKIIYYIANGKKIAIVSATEIERSANYTKEATANSAGVLKTLNPERFINVIKEAESISDYVIAVVHWGTEGNLYPDDSQKRLSEAFVSAGADVIIGGHPHRLQGAGFVDDVPVAYSLGNFWFSTGTLYTTVTEVAIKEDGSLSLKYLPCVQKDLTTSLITDTTEMEEFYHYLAAISNGIGIDATGTVYNKTAQDYPVEQILYDSDTSTTPVIGASDNEGNAIDIVGNRK